MDSNMCAGRTFEFSFPQVMLYMNEEYFPSVEAIIFHAI
jgi:hypothetical protein